MRTSNRKTRAYKTLRLTVSGTKNLPTTGIAIGSRITGLSAIFRTSQKLVYRQDRRRPPQEVPKVKSRPQAAGKRHDSHQRVTTRAGSASGPDKFNEATILQLQARMAAGTLSSVATLLAPQAPDSLPSTHSRIRQVCRIRRIRRIRQVLTTKLGWE